MVVSPYWLLVQSVGALITTRLTFFALLRSSPQFAVLSAALRLSGRTDASHQCADLFWRKGLATVGALHIESLYPNVSIVKRKIVEREGFSGVWKGCFCEQATGL